MNASDLVRRLHQHRMWVNRGLLEAARPLSEEQLRRPLPIGQGSVWKTLTHLMGADYMWLEVLTGNETPLTPGDLPGKITGNQEGEGAVATLDELAARWGELDGRWGAYLATLTDGDLDQVVHRFRPQPAPGQRFSVKRSDALLHVCTHAQYTTAQLVNMLRQLGVEKFPEVMLVAMARQEAAAAG